MLHRWQRFSVFHPPVYDHLILQGAVGGCGGEGGLSQLILGEARIHPGQVASSSHSLIYPVTQHHLHVCLVQKLNTNSGFIIW